MNIFAALLHQHRYSKRPRLRDKTYLIGPTVWLELGPIPIENRSNVEMTACSALGGRPILVGVGVGGREITVELDVLAELDDDVEVSLRLVFDKGIERKDGACITCIAQHMMQRDVSVTWTYSTSYSYDFDRLGWDPG